MELSIIGRNIDQESIYFRVDGVKYGIDSNKQLLDRHGVPYINPPLKLIEVKTQGAKKLYCFEQFIIEDELGHDLKLRLT